MATKKLNVQVIAQITPDTGLEPICAVDTDSDAFAPLAITGFTEWRTAEIQLAAAAVDTAFTFTEAVAFLLFADEPISLKLAAGESELTNIRFAGWCADDEDDDVHSTSVLLSNPGASAAQVKVLYLEKP